jgi:RNA polymerase sigma-70 factor (ECF subfamily)
MEGQKGRLPRVEQEVYVVSYGPFRASQDDQQEMPFPPETGGPPSEQESWQGEVVKRSLEGDELAFACIVDAYGGLLLRTAFLLLRDEEMAKDTVQDAFFLAWKRLETLHDPALLRPWLLKIVVNQTTSLKRQLARQTRLLRERLNGSEMPGAANAGTPALERREDWLDMQQALADLPMNQRVVLVLFYYHRLTMPEIATLLGVAENTLRKRLQAALKNIRRRLRIELSPPEPRKALRASGEDRPPINPQERGIS